MKRQRNEQRLALAWIALYVLAAMLADAVSESLGMIKCITVPVCALLSAALYVQIRRDGLQAYYGLGRGGGVKGKDVLFYLPLLALASSNLWNGVTIRFSAVETALYVVSMCLVGFLEEVIFRGLLFRALSPKGLKQAIVISSLTFGMGHIVNLLAGAEPISTLLQICYATAIGFLFTTIFFKKRHAAALYPDACGGKRRECVCGSGKPGRSDLRQRYSDRGFPALRAVPIKKAE